MNKKKDKIVYIKLDTWNDMKDGTWYLEELEDGKHNNEINYSEVWYEGWAPYKDFNRQIIEHFQKQNN